MNDNPFQQLARLEQGIQHAQPHQLHALGFKLKQLRREIRRNPRFEALLSQVEELLTYLNQKQHLEHEAKEDSATEEEQFTLLNLSPARIVSTLDRKYYGDGADDEAEEAQSKQIKERIDQKPPVAGGEEGWGGDEIDLDGMDFEPVVSHPESATAPSQKILPSKRSWVEIENQALEEVLASKVSVAHEPTTLVRSMLTQFSTLNKEPSYLRQSGSLFKGSLKSSLQLTKSTGKNLTSFLSTALSKQAVKDLGKGVSSTVQTSQKAVAQGISQGISSVAKRINNPGSHDVFLQVNHLKAHQYAGIQEAIRQRLSRIEAEKQKALGAEEPEATAAGTSKEAAVQSPAAAEEVSEPQKSKKVSADSDILKSLNQKLFLSKAELAKAKGIDSVELERQEGEQIQVQMVSMAQGMKQIAQQFQVQFEQDAKVMSKIENRQEENMRKTEVENQRLDKLKAATLTSFCQKVFYLLVGVAVFAAMVVFIWLVPDKVRHENLGSEMQRRWALRNN